MRSGHQGQSAAIQTVEREEKSPRRWYGGAVGIVGFDGRLNTGLTLRTVHVQEGKASVRAGATLLFDSDPELEERETRIKASAFLDSLTCEQTLKACSQRAYRSGAGKKVLLVDHRDSFVHSLGNYLCQTGAEVVTLRSGCGVAAWEEVGADLVVLSPGPGRPSDFQIDATMKWATSRGLPVLGVCLGLQGIVEYFGGSLRVLERPMHGKSSRVRVVAGSAVGQPGEEYQVGRYHSLFALEASLPSVLRVTAMSDDDVVMAIEHIELPICAVQFHPESILTLSGANGLKVLDSALDWLLNRPLRVSTKWREVVGDVSLTC